MSSAHLLGSQNTLKLMPMFLCLFVFSIEIIFFLMIEENQVINVLLKDHQLPPGGMEQ